MNKGKIQLELIWWVFTALLVFAILYPITSKISGYPFLITNIIFIVAFVTCSRYIFLLKHTFLANQQKVKLVLVFLSIPIIAILVSRLYDFQVFLDEDGIAPIIEKFEFAEGLWLSNYLRNEMLFFGVGSLIAAVIMPFRMILSIWRTRNRGTV